MKPYDMPEFSIYRLLRQDVISTSYLEDLSQPWAEDYENWELLP